jgi:hypothetical protein
MGNGPSDPQSRKPAATATVRIGSPVGVRSRVGSVPHMKPSSDGAAFVLSF